MRIAASIALAACVGLAACVPLLPHTYYRPEATGGTTPRNPCWNTHESVAFVSGAAELTTRIIRRGPDRTFVQLTIELPQGHHARLQGGDLELIEPSGTRQRLSFDGVAENERVDGARLPIGTRFYGQTFTTYPQRIVRNYWLFAPIDLRDRSAFAITLPTIEIDDVPVHLPEIRFTRTTDVQPLAPLQC